MIKKYWLWGMLLLILTYSLVSCQNTNNTFNETGDEAGFKYTEVSEDVEACYISVVYMDGYAYSPIGWFSDDLYSKHAFEKGEKIGEVTLDLKGLNYTGLPPNFSSTHDKGSLLYEIEGVKKERAILLVENGYETVLYRERKSLQSENDPIDMKLFDLFEMIATTPEVVSVELRSEENGSWMGDIYNEELIQFFNEHAKDLTIFNHGELENDPYSSPRIPINLLFEDGAAVHMQVYPNTHYAYVFGGYVQVTDAFIETLKSAIEADTISPTIVELISLNEQDINFMSIKDYYAENTITCSEPNWSAGALYMILSYYRVTEIDKPDSEPLVVFTLGTTEDNRVEVILYKDDTLSINDAYYEIYKGQFTYEDVLLFIDSYTN